MIKVNIRRLLLSTSLLLMANFVNSEEMTIFGESDFSVFPPEPSTSQPIVITTYSSVCGGVYVGSVDVIASEALVRVALESYRLYITPCLAPVHLLEIPVDGIEEEGTYRVELYLSLSSAEETQFKPQHFAGSFEFDVATSLPVYNVETPIHGAIYSGIGIVRGWACNAESVQVQFNDNEPLSVAYGSSRPDTIGMCGDEANGYGLVVGWGNLGKGTHTARTYIDGVKVSEVEFEVNGLDEPFLRDLSGEYVLEDFPVPGETVTVRWSEPDQNFIIVDHTNSNSD